MYIGGKLEVFTQMSMRDAEAKRKEIFEEVESAFQKATSEIKKTAERKAQDELASETGKAQQQRNKQVLAAQAETKHVFVEKRTELIDSLFAEVQKKLVEFTKTDGYKKYLLNEAGSLKKKYGEIEFILSPGDMGLVEDLAAVGVKARPSDEDFLGGFIAYIPAKHALLNKSFRAKLRDEKDNFNMLKNS